MKKNLSLMERKVKKSNELIQKNRLTLNVTCQKAIAYICSLIDDEENAQLEYQFNLDEFAEVCGVNGKDGRFYEDIKNTLQTLRDKSYWVYTEQGLSLVSWLNKAWLPEGNRTIKIRLDEEMIPYLFGLKVKFTQYGLGNICRMKSTYSIKMFELLKSYQWQGVKKSFDIDEFKTLMGIDDIKSYSHDFSLLRIKVIEPALKEINKYTDIKVSVEYKKHGRKVNEIIFYVNEKDSSNMNEWSTYSQLKGQQVVKRIKIDD